MIEFNNFDSIKIGLASPDKIRSWSKGEVRKPETINYRTLKPEKEGLFCEKIFGPQKDWECHCGKYKKVRYKGVVCDRCGVEVTKSKVRRERMGHIELAAPVSHIWYFKGIPSKMGILLDMSPRSLEKVLYFASYIVTESGETSLEHKQLLTESEHSQYREKYGNAFKAGMGAEAVQEVLNQIDLDALSKELKAQLKESTGQKKIRIVRRLEVVEAFRNSGNNPSWMILETVPVIPPDLRPMVQLDGGRFATADLNDLYRRVINRNNRLKRLLELGAPDIIVRNEKRMLQEAVDALIDNGRRGRPVTGPGNRPLKSLSDLLKGKQGRFRQNLLGKRVDYSGRSVIVVGPELKFYQCGLPKTMALELFKPFVMKRLVKDGYVHNIKSAKRMVERVKPEVWDIVEEVIKEHPVLLNRAPTLHRLGIQAFEPILVEGKAIRLHPLVCTAYNADFDGDQMAVHVPLSVEAQAEARFMMLSVNNILAPKDGKPITTPTQDMVLGAYYLTYESEEQPERMRCFKNFDEMMIAYDKGVVSLHHRVKVKTKIEDNKHIILESTVGRFIFNQDIPQDLGFVNREENPYGMEIDFLCKKGDLENIISRSFHRYGNTITSQLLDHMKTIGFKYSTKAAITVAVDDMDIPEEKAILIENAREVVEKYKKAYKRGLISDDERYQKTIAKWTETTDEVTDALMKNLTSLNNIKVMADSGARGSKNQIRQLAGMRGLMANATGKTVEIPIISNFREGLTVLEYFISTTGARKGLADTALRTADSGYLTRRLVDVSQEVIVREIDCGSQEGIEVVPFREGNELIESLEERIIGRYPAQDIAHPKTGEIICSVDEMIDEDKATRIVKEAGYEKVTIRSVLTCDTQHGVCSKCYGLNLATGRPVHVGEAVGIIAAQSIGEPGTQLTMRTFHTGGVAGGDITQGLPRVEELFEGRKPKGLAVISEIDGIVSLRENKKKNEIVIKNQETGEEFAALLVFGSKLKVEEGDQVVKGQPLTEGSINPHDLLRVVGVTGVREYIIKEVQKVYRLQGVDIDDKHIEIIVKQMLSKIKIDESGDTLLFPGTVIEMKEFNKINEKIISEGGEPATGIRSLLGITKASLATNSFLSAASFQETTRVLTEAAIMGKEDRLLGLKENVIIGKLIPAGTGMRYYKQLTVKKNDPYDLDHIDVVKTI